MNKLFVSLFAASAAVCSLCAAEPVKVENTPAPAQNPAGAGAYDGMKAYEDWSLFQFSVIPQWPSQDRLARFRRHRPGVRRGNFLGYGRNLHDQGIAGQLDLLPEP